MRQWRRTIKAIKAFYEERKKRNTGKDWKQIWKEAVVFYNEVHVHRATKMTHEAAREPTNKVEVKEKPREDQGDNKEIS